MTEIKYHCWFNTWDKFMDGELIIGDIHFNYDFVTEGEDHLGDGDHILAVFSEEGARNHFHAHGIHNIEFVYDKEDL